MTYEERCQIEYLQNRKDELLSKFIGACEEINAQIDDVRKGVWLQKRSKEEQKNAEHE